MHGMLSCTKVDINIASFAISTRNHEQAVEPYKVAMEDITRTNFIFGLLTTMTIPILCQDSQNTCLKQLVNDNKHEVYSISLTDFIDDDHKDATDGFIDLINALNSTARRYPEGVIPIREVYS